MKKTIFSLFVLFFVSFTCFSQNQEFKTAVKEAVVRQMETYPQSTLKDLYKNFFQDKFGPGHLIADTTAAGNYIRRELASFTTSDGLLLEPTGWEGRFYRVNLSLLKDGTIPYDVFFDAFVRSVNSIDPIPVEAWHIEWKEIERIIAGMELKLVDYVTDREEIDERLSCGEYVGHHSEQFEAHYSPHYRIISKEIVEEELQLYLKALED
ncbi:hypothetical protein [Massilibacteroides vaginae]|uniref:hypothetical protein n=1 Tax=Massilibacteroides vaginae TaxID=1673718 RepID=UPI000A1C8F55|nr:hypothetical protein [Massilibacteroides vaginae]